MGGVDVREHDRRSAQNWWRRERDWDGVIARVVRAVDVTLDADNELVNLVIIAGVQATDDSIIIVTGGRNECACGRKIGGVARIAPSVAHLATDIETRPRER